jgi:legumain
MFDGILSDKINAYAVTAANPGESSWGTYCYPDDIINGTHVNSCLGDLFSVNWMENLEASDPGTETLETQFQKIKVATAQSHVMRYGDMSFTSQPIGNFEGTLDKETKKSLFD